MCAAIVIASSRPSVAQALAERLREAGHECAAHDGTPPPRDAVVVCDVAGLNAAYASAGGRTLFIEKPMKLSQLLARVQALAEASASGVAVNEAWELSPSERLLKRKDGAEIALTEKEAALIAYFLARPGQAATRQELLEQVWGYASDIATHTLETHIYRLRAKLAGAGAGEWIAATDTGYRLAA
jgi:DNA-binding response OmpR family regulator